ncbi:hypothetical protein L603_002200000080 [Cellulosimicrobium cellulans J34]|nr:hypothetical protein L603_002200000080 [Cellulosimicrobium cellulans J34]SMF44164.1 hypothetical protein SAMN02744115_03329 [Cellulosimicrobium cellulans J1]
MSDAQTSATAPTADNVVLVHGAYADGSSWAAVVGLLQEAGLTVTAVQNPLTSLADDAAATWRALDRQDGPTVLAGHSWAGTVISEVGDHETVSSLVYVAARAPDAGEDYGALAATFPTPPANAGLVRSDDGFAQLSEAAFLDDFANGVDPARARVLHAVPGAGLGHPVRVPDHAGGVARQAVLVRGLPRRPDDVSGARAVPRRPHGRHDDRARQRTPLDRHAPARDREPRPRRRGATAARALTSRRVREGTPRRCVTAPGAGAGRPRPRRRRRRTGRSRRAAARPPAPSP